VDRVLGVVVYLCGGLFFVVVFFDFAGVFVVLLLHRMFLYDLGDGVVCVELCCGVGRDFFCQKGSCCEGGAVWFVCVIVMGCSV